jgi:hypothetical protein
VYECVRRKSIHPQQKEASYVENARFGHGHGHDIQVGHIQGSLMLDLASSQGCKTVMPSRSAEEVC